MTKIEAIWFAEDLVMLRKLGRKRKNFKICRIFCSAEVQSLCGLKICFGFCTVSRFAVGFGVLGGLQNRVFNGTS